MSDNIPFEIQVEIIKRVLPVKSLIRFRSVSKQWKSLIDSPQFFADHHSLNQAQPRHLLITYKDKFVSIADDDSFPNNKFSPILPPPAKLLEHTSMINCPHGLVCLYGYRNKLILLWNPSIRKFVVIPSPYVFDVVGFGVCPKTSDPKIVTFTHADGAWKAEVFTLSSRAWRSVSVNPRWSCDHVPNNQVVIDGAIHWVGFDSVTECHQRIVSFDLTSEELGEVDLPDSLAHSGSTLSISELKGSLAVLNHDVDTPVCEVWMMTNNGDTKSRFTKQYTVSINGAVDASLRVIIGFRKNGQPITEHIRDTGGLFVTTLEAYDSSSEHYNDFGMDVAYNSVFKMTSYTESLLLLNHSDSIVQ